MKHGASHGRYYPWEAPCLCERVFLQECFYRYLRQAL